MHRLIAFFAWFLVFSGLASAQDTAITSMTAAPTTATVGTSVGFTATVQPSTAPGGGKPLLRPTGTVTFLDGTTPLSSTPIAVVPNGLTSATFPQTFGTPDPTLVTPPGLLTTYVSGEVPGDLNGDGIPDLLIYFEEEQFSVQTFTSNGKGGYTTGVTQTLPFPVSGSPLVVNTPQLIDINGDGKLDLLIGLQVAYGNGDGTFAQAVPVPFLSSGFVGSFAADVDGDGKTDILAVPAITDDPFVGDPFQFAFTVFLNQGGGTFVSAGTFPASPVVSYGNPGIAGEDFFAPLVVDLNGDGKADLIAQNQTFGATQVNGTLQVNVLLNNGAGTFGSPITISIPNPPNYGLGPTAYEMATGDVNNDGKQDLILTLSDTGENVDLIVLLGNGDGTFQAPSYLVLESEPGLAGQSPLIVVQDLNLDGNPDLIFGNGEVALGDGKGGFALTTPLFPFQSVPITSKTAAFPLVQMNLAGTLLPSLVYWLPTATPPATSVFTPQPSSSAMLSLVSLAAGTHTVTATYSGDTNYSADTSAPVTVTINQAASAVALTSSANPSVSGQSVTFTANVTSSGPTPTGNVVFSSGSTTLGTVPLSGGSAAYTTTSLTTAGTQTITASYSGDGNTQASSGTLSQVVNAPFSITPESSGNTTLTATSGKTASATIQVAGTAGFSGQITLACSGLPASASCSFSPATVTVSGTSPVAAQLSVNTSGNTTMSRLGREDGFSGVAYGISLAGLLMLWPIRRRLGRIGVLWLCVAAFTLPGLNGCSGGGNTAKTAVGTYSFTVTASSGNMQIRSAFTLVVQ